EMPAPMTQTSAAVSWVRAGGAGMSCVAIQSEWVSPESLGTMGMLSGGGRESIGILRRPGARGTKERRGARLAALYPGSICQKLSRANSASNMGTARERLPGDSENGDSPAVAEA